MSAPLSEKPEDKTALDADEKDTRETDDVVDGTDTDTGDSTEEKWDPDRAKAAMSKKNRENESLRRRLKELEDRDRILREIEDKGKSDTERLTERATKESEKATKLELENNRLQLRLELGLTADQAARVTGDNYDDMKADAEELLKLFQPSKGDEADKPTKTTEKRRPAADALKGGLKPNDGDDKFDVASTVERIWKQSHVF